MNPIWKAIRPAVSIPLRFADWVMGEAWEKINIAAKWREIKAEGKKHGLRFIIFAVLWECIEDGLFPYLAIRNGMPALAPFFLVMHFEPLVYPAFFWVCRVIDRKRGLIPMEPDRTAQSSNLRSAGKVLVYKFAATGWYGMILMGLGFSAKILGVFVALMVAFGFVHERIWHDSNFGIGDDDHVSFKRVAAKTASYAVVSTTVLASLFRVAFDGVPWLVLLACQALGMVFYFTHEAVWSRSKWGVSRIVRDGGEGAYRRKLSPELALVGSISEAASVTVIPGRFSGTLKV